LTYTRWLKTKILLSLNPLKSLHAQTTTTEITDSWERQQTDRLHMTLCPPLDFFPTGFQFKAEMYCYFCECLCYPQYSRHCRYDKHKKLRMHCYSIQSKALPEFLLGSEIGLEEELDCQL